jgi:hypothetical protein
VDGYSAAAKLKWEKERFHKNRGVKYTQILFGLKILLTLTTQCIMTISGIAYGDYPVVGVKWTQAKLLCLENTKQNSYIKSKKKGHD